MLKVTFSFLLLGSILFSSKIHEVSVKIRIMKLLVVKLGYKRGGKSAIGIVKLGFWFG